MLSLALAPVLALTLSAAPVKPAAEAASLTPTVSPCAVDRDAAFARYVVPELHVNRSPLGLVDRAAPKPAKPAVKPAPVCLQAVRQPLASPDSPRPSSF